MAPVKPRDTEKERYVHEFMRHKPPEATRRDSSKRVRVGVTGKSRRPVMKILLGNRPSGASLILARITGTTRDAWYILRENILRELSDSTKFINEKKTDAGS